MALAIFDLDNTLLAGDSDYLWGRYLCENNIVDEVAYRTANDHFYQQYVNGSLDIYEFLEFVFTPYANHSMQDLKSWRAAYLEEKIKPIILPAGIELIETHRAKGDTLLIITATNTFLTQPIAELLGIEHLIGTEPEMLNGEFTGKVSGTPSFQHGKIERLKMWLNHRDDDMENSIFYSDSHNDIPLLELVDTAVAVNPDDKLEAVAKEKGWKILSLRE